MTKTLLPHQQRVVEEQAELQKKLDSLGLFIRTGTFVTLPDAERMLLSKQWVAMSSYNDILQQRIRLFNGVKQYTCHKQVLARSMTLGDYYQLQRWGMSVGEDPADAGYLVEYLDGGEPNHPDFAHYISWSPKDVFERDYTENPQ